MAHSTYPWFSFRILKELHVCNLTNYIRHTKGRYQETIHLNTSILLYCTPVHNSTEKHLLFTSNQDQINVPINSYRNLTNFQKLHHPHSLKKANNHINPIHTADHIWPAWCGWWTNAHIHTNDPLACHINNISTFQIALVSLHTTAVLRWLPTWMSSIMFAISKLNLQAMLHSKPHTSK